MTATLPDTFTNNAVSSVSGGAGGAGTTLLATDTSLLLPTGDGAKFPSLANSTLLLGSLSSAYELVQMTARSSDTLTILRGQEGTAARSWPVGTPVEQIVSAGNLTRLTQGSTQVYNVLAYGARGNGVTDDTSAILSAIAAAAAAGGGVVFFPPGTYVTSASLVQNADGVILRGAGMQSSVIQPASGAQFDVISSPIPAASGTAGYTHYYLGIESLHIDCANMTGTTAGQGNAIHWYGVRYGWIRDCLITSSPNWCIIFDGDATPNFGYNCEVRGCTFDLCAAGILHAGSEAHEIVQNKFKYAKTATAALQPTFSSPSTTAMHLWCTGGYDYIAGNVFGNSGNYTSEAIRLANSGPSKIVGNRFDQCHAEAIRTTSGNQIIVGNQIGNPGSTVASKPGITLGSTNNVVTGNKFDVTNGAAAFTYCIAEPSAQSNNVITGNALVAGTSGFVSLNASSTGDIVANNIGYNPVGQVTAPTFPATTVGVTNNTGVHVTAYIANGIGAITVVQVAGAGGTYVTTGYQIAASGWGHVRIPAGGSVKFTYASGTPTWTWMGE